MHLAWQRIKPTCLQRFPDPFAILVNKSKFDDSVNVTIGYEAILFDELELLQGSVGCDNAAKKDA